MIQNLKNIYDENSDDIFNRHEQKLFKNFFFINFVDKKNEILKQFLARFLFTIASFQLLDKFKINYFKRTIATRYVIKENFNLKKITTFQKYVVEIRKLKTSLKSVDNRIKFSFIEYIKSRATRSINSSNSTRKMNKIVVTINYLRRFLSQIQKKIKKKKLCDKCFQKSHVYTQVDVFCKNKKFINMKRKTNSICETRNRLKRSISRRKNVKHRVSTLWNIRVYVQWSKLKSLEKLNVLDENRIQKLLKETRKRISQLKKQQKKIVDTHLVIVNLFFCYLNTRTIILRNENQLNFDIIILNFKEWQRISFMIDSRVFASNFVNVNFVKLHKILTMILTKLINFIMINDDKVYRFTRIVQIKFILSDHIDELWCLMISLKKYDIIMSMSWVKNHEILINDRNRILIFQFDECIINCIHNHRSTKIFNKTLSKHRLKKSFDKFSKKTTKNINIANITKITIFVFFKMIDQKKNQIIIMWF